MTTNSKFIDLETQIFAVFGTEAWVAEAIAVYPTSYIKTATDTEFCRLSIIASGRGVNLKSVNGMLIMEIFVPFGIGPKRASMIADKLDKYFVGKTLGTTETTQFMESHLAPNGKDSANPTLYKSTYTIAFRHYGV